MPNHSNPSVAPLLGTRRALLLHALTASQFARPLLGLAVPLIRISLVGSLSHCVDGGRFVVLSRGGPGLRTADVANGGL